MEMQANKQAAAIFVSSPYSVYNSIDLLYLPLPQALLLEFFRRVCLPICLFLTLRCTACRWHAADGWPYGRANGRPYGRSNGRPYGRADGRAYDDAGANGRARTDARPDAAPQVRADRRMGG